jgi:hypothetical protein
MGGWLRFHLFCIWGLLILVPILDAVQLAPHPRLLLTGGRAEDVWRDRVQTNSVLRPILDYVLAGADAIIDASPVERRLIGRRMLNQSRIALKRFVYLSTAYRVTGQRKYVDRAVKELRAVAAFEDWNPSHFLDVAEMTLGVALAYDWMYSELSVEERALVERMMIDKGLKPSFEKNHSNLWVRGDNNWNQVCHGGMVFAALALYEQVPQLAEQTIRRAVERLPRAMAVYAPGGVYPEGPSYWVYGTTYNVLLIDALRSALGTDYGLTDLPGFLESSEYYLHAEGPTGLLFNFSDGGELSHLTPAPFWFAREWNKPELLYHQFTKIEPLLKRRFNPNSSSDRLLPLVLLWAPPDLEMRVPKQLKGRSCRAVCPVHRSADRASVICAFPSLRTQIDSHASECSKMREWNDLD